MVKVNFAVHYQKTSSEQTLIADKPKVLLNVLHTSTFRHSPEKVAVLSNEPGPNT